MFAGHYEEWRNARLFVMDKYLGHDFFTGKSVLELGCGYGDIGAAISQRGGIVTCSDARAEHIEVLKAKHATVRTRIDDLDKPLKYCPSFDVIVHFGVLYHLRDARENLLDVAKYCNYLILETEVCDSSEEFAIATPENGYDQAFNAVGTRPSPSLVEKYLNEAGFHFQMIMDKDMNAEFHMYTWEITNSKTWRHGLRRFWICWKKDLPSILKSDTLTK